MQTPQLGGGRAALFSLFVVAAYIHPSTLPVSLRSKTVIPDAGLDGPLNPTSAAMKVIAPDMFFATVATTEGQFTIQVTRSWAPHAADRFYNWAKNGQSARSLMLLRCMHPPLPCARAFSFLPACRILQWLFDF